MARSEYACSRGVQFWWLVASALVSLVFAVRIVVALCPGDCDGDGEVVVPELMQGVNAALGIAPVGVCPQFDTDVDDRVTVNEILGAVDIALSICPLDPTVSFHNTYRGSFFGDTETRGHALAVADLEGDGHLDAVIPGLFGRHRVSVFRGRGDGSFNVGRHFEAGHTPIAMVTGDFNGDQRVDVAVTGEARRLLTVVLGNGDGTLGSPATYPVRLSPRAVAAGDLNRDAALDIVVVNRGTDDLSVFLGRGDGTFPASEILPSAGSSPDGIAIVDLNHDDDPDLVVANRGSGTLAVFLAEAGGAFATPATYNVPLSPLSMTAGDFNEDGHVDVVVTSLGTDILSFVPGNGDGTLGTARTIIDLPSIHRAASADLNGDGHLDVVAGSYINADTVMSLLGRGDGTFELAQEFSSDGGEVFALELEDINDDGIPDLVTDSGLTLRGNGDGTFATAPRLGFGARGTADINGDGHSDLVTANQQGLGVALGNGTGTFTEPPRTAGFVRSLVFGDLDNDGRSDAVGLNDDNALIFFRGQSDGFFSPGQPVNAVGEPIAIADVNHDEIPDLFLADSILLGNGDSTLQAAVKFVPHELFWCPSRNVAFADLNGDGHLDLVTAPPNTFVACTFLGNGDGTMTAGGLVEIGRDPGSVALADFNEDGVPDLVVGKITRTRHLSILLGKGDGTFGPSRAFFSGPTPRSLVALDLNGDRHVDVAVVTEFDAVAVLLGRGDGTLHYPVFFGAGRGPGSIMAGDFNEDRRPDLAITAMFRASTTLLLAQ